MRPILRRPEKFREALTSEYAHGYFLGNFKRAFVPIDIYVRTKFEVRS